MSTRLNISNYKELADSVVLPKYNFDKVKAGIVHIGIGAFHRGHQAVYTDDAMAISGGNWGIIGVSLRSAGVSEQLNPQNGLYTLTEKSENTESTRLISSIKEVLVAPQQKQRVIDTLASPNVKVITLTVTEKGYHFDMGSGQLMRTNEDIAHDIANLSSPKSMPGFIVAACKKRMLGHPDAKLSIISCDNLPENGEITKKVVTELASLAAPEVVDWIASHVNFCSSMVDRIVPAVSDKSRRAMANKLGMQDEGMIETESFKQWVIEDNFCTSIPDWQSVGVLIVDKVQSYEKLKLRTLNGSHSALAYMGVLLGYEFIHEAVCDSALLPAIKWLMQDETGPSLDTPKGFDLRSYQQEILSRFKNNKIAYKTQQVAMDGSQKMIQRIFAPIMDNYANGREDHCVILLSVVAAWLRYLQGCDEAGNTYEISDPMANELKQLSTQHKHNTEMLIKALCDTGIVPTALSKSNHFIDSLNSTYERLNRKGLKQHLQSFRYHSGS